MIKIPKRRSPVRWVYPGIQRQEWSDGGIHCSRLPQHSCHRVFRHPDCPRNQRNRFNARRDCRIARRRQDELPEPADSRAYVASGRQTGCGNVPRITGHHSIGRMYIARTFPYDVIHVSSRNPSGEDYRQGLIHFLIRSHGELLRNTG